MLPAPPKGLSAARLASTATICARALRTTLIAADSARASARNPRIARSAPKARKAPPIKAADIWAPVSKPPSAKATTAACKGQIRFARTARPAARDWAARPGASQSAEDDAVTSAFLDI